MEQYVDLVSHVLLQGTRKENRTGVDTISTFNYNYEIDLAGGFPLLTTKSISWKNIVIENLHFLSGRCDAGFLDRHGCKFWAPWTDARNLLPESSYGDMWRNFPTGRTLHQVPARIRDREEPEPVRVGIARPADPSCARGNEMYLQSSGQLRIIGDSPLEGGRAAYVVQFEDTGFVRDQVRLDHIRAGSVRDPYATTVFGVGYIGEMEDSSQHPLYSVWAHMLERCYNPAAHEYGAYGGRGVFVQRRWHCFTNFVLDAPTLPGWRRYCDEPSRVALDKDFYGSNCYGPDTCVWLDRGDNAKYRSNVRAFVAIDSNGARSEFLTQVEAAESLGVDQGSISLCLRGKQAHAAGFRFEYLPGSNYRYTTSNDQIKWILEELKRNPMSRRLVVSAWAPGNAQTSKLPPCHALWILNVQNSQTRAGSLLGPVPRLCLHLTQRSCDVALGVPYNIAGYAFILSVIAHLTGFRPGIFAHTLVDAHIYTAKPDGSMAEYDHIPGLREQIRRQPRELPTLTISPNIRSLEDIEKIMHEDTDTILDHFKLTNYNPHPAIPFKVAV